MHICILVVWTELFTVGVYDSGVTSSVVFKVFYDLTLLYELSENNTIVNPKGTKLSPALTLYIIKMSKKNPATTNFFQNISRGQEG